MADHPPVKAVLLDFGGTLFSYASTEPGRRKRARMLAEELGHDDHDAVYDALHHGMREAFRRANEQAFYLHFEVAVSGFREATSRLGVPWSEDQCRAMAERTSQTGFEGLQPRPGMRETLEALRDQGVHLGGVSNADDFQLDAMVERLGVADVFHHLLSSESARSCKPDPAIFRLALAQAGCAPQETLFVGDTPDADIVGAEAVGMRPVLIEETTEIAIDRGRPKPGQLTLRELPELLDLI